MYLKTRAMKEFFNPKVGLRVLFSGPHWLAPYHHVSPSFNSLPSLEADPPASVAALQHTDVTRVAARSNFPDEDSARHAFRWGANCYIWNFAVDALNA